MSEEQGLFTEHIDRNHFDGDLYTSTQILEHDLNAAIVEAQISESFEEHLAIFDAFYADDIEVSVETADEPIRGKARVRSILANFLYPVHVMAEVGGLMVTIRQTAMAWRCSGRDALCLDTRVRRYPAKLALCVGAFSGDGMGRA